MESPWTQTPTSAGQRRTWRHSCSRPTSSTGCPFLTKEFKKRIKTKLKHTTEIVCHPSTRQWPWLGNLGFPLVFQCTFKNHGWDLHSCLLLVSRAVKIKSTVSSSASLVEEQAVFNSTALFLLPWETQSIKEGFFHFYWPLHLLIAKVIPVG